VSAPNSLAVFSDYACPWCFLGFSRLARIREQNDLTVDVIGYPLNTEAVPEGRDLEGYMCAKGIPVEAVDRLAELCAAEGIAYPTQLEGRRVWNTSRAQEMAIWASERLSPDQLFALHMRLFEAYHIENLNLYDFEVLGEIAEGFGLDADELSGDLSTGTYAEAREWQWELARQAGVRGVPTFVSGTRIMAGAQERAALEQLIA
jgi:predicted DsbA family dithiol-disulfide isomerase